MLTPSQSATSNVTDSVNLCSDTNIGWVVVTTQPPQHLWKNAKSRSETSKKVFSLTRLLADSQKHVYRTFIPLSI